MNGPLTANDNGHDLSRRLRALGVSKTAIRRLLKHDPETVHRWMCYVESHIDEFENPAGFLVKALDEGWMMPEGFRTPEEEAAERAEQERREAELRRLQEEAEAERRRPMMEAIARVNALPARERRRLEKEARAALPPGVSEAMARAMLPGIMAALS